jgi:hypothetical protein
MKDMQAHLEKLRVQISECEMIRDLATDRKKRELFVRLAEHFTALASEIEKAMADPPGFHEPSGPLHQRRFVFMKSSYHRGHAGQAVMEPPYSLVIPRLTLRTAPHGLTISAPLNGNPASIFLRSCQHGVSGACQCASACGGHLPQSKQRLDPPDLDPRRVNRNRM